MYALNQFVDNQFMTPGNTGDPTSDLNGAYSTEDLLDTQLKSANAVYYTDEMLAQMTMNDKIFAVRVAQELDGGIGIWTPPVALFTFTPALLVVDFTDQSSSPNGIAIVSYAWDFGDSGSSTAQNPQHTYAAPGDYDVTLTVTNNLGLTDSHTDTVSVTDVP